MATRRIRTRWPGCVRRPATATGLPAQTADAQTRGLFGAPAFTTARGEMLWGNDRLEQALRWAKK